MLKEFWLRTGLGIAYISFTIIIVSIAMCFLMFYVWLFTTSTWLVALKVVLSVPVAILFFYLFGTMVREI